MAGACAEHGALYATAQIYRRVWQLYVAHIFLFVIFTAEVSYTVLVVRNPMYADEMGVGDFLETPHLAIIRALLLSFQPTFLDILPLYIVLLAGFPLVLLALRAPSAAAARALGGCSTALTLLRGWAPTTFPADHAWFFNPLAWQFLFVIGATAGYSRVTGAWPFPSRQVAHLAVGRHRRLSRDHQPELDDALALRSVPAASWRSSFTTHTIDKTNLAPLRLINFLAIAVTTVAFVKPDSAFLRKRWAWPVILCGQHSLYVFCVGIVLSVLGHFLLAELYGGIFDAGGGQSGRHRA